jgi:ketosteroid isomerase-like protein
MADLEAPIQAMIDATNRGDNERFLAAFADDAVLTDWGRTFTGKSEIAGWNDTDNIGRQGHFEVTGVERSGNQINVGVEVSGNGFNGPSTFVFEVDERGIKRMVISG